MTKHEELIKRLRSHSDWEDNGELLHEAADALESLPTPPAGEPFGFFDQMRSLQVVIDAANGDGPPAPELSDAHLVALCKQSVITRGDQPAVLRAQIALLVQRFEAATKTVAAGEPEREALASIISITLAMRRLRINPQPKAHEWIDGDIADAILAAGWRRQPEPREVTRVEELDALPVGSIVESSRDGETVTARKPLDGAFPFATDRFWETVGSELGTGAEDLIPARILFTPSTERGES